MSVLGTALVEAEKALAPAVAGVAVLVPAMEAAAKAGWNRAAVQNPVGASSFLLPLCCRTRPTTKDQCLSLPSSTRCVASLLPSQNPRRAFRPSLASRLGTAWRSRHMYWTNYRPRYRPAPSRTQASPDSRDVEGMPQGTADVRSAPVRLKVPKGAENAALGDANAPYAASMSGRGFVPFACDEAQGILAPSICC